MQSKQNKEKAKQAYEKPRLRTIELAAEEVLGIGCKLDSGPSNYTSPTTCATPQCVQGDLS